MHVLVDVGTEDKFLKDGQLEPDTLKEAAKENGRQEGEVQIRMQEGYDHSYFFVSTLLWESNRGLASIDLACCANTEKDLHFRSRACRVPRKVSQSLGPIYGQRASIRSAGQE